jgi:hypothetical protein
VLLRQQQGRPGAGAADREVDPEDLARQRIV